MGSLTFWCLRFPLVRRSLSACAARQIHEQPRCIQGRWIRSVLASPFLPLASVCLKICFSYFGFERNLSLLGLCSFQGRLKKWKLGRTNRFGREVSESLFMQINLPEMRADIGSLAMFRASTVETPVRLPEVRTILRQCWAPRCN